MNTQSSGDRPLGTRRQPEADQIVTAELADKSNRNFEQPFATEPESDASFEHSSGEVDAGGLIERMLSAQNLNRMMMVGGCILAVGFGIWLWSIGIFENAWILAVTVGAANLGCLAGGMALLKKTRYSTAGLGILMLSCLIMPTNLWLYHSQNLIVLGSGGQLWVPALIMSIIYAWVARSTRNSIFVYTLLAGVAMTGLLFLAGTSTALLWQSLPISTFLVSIGALAIQADRWFTEKDGAFSRPEFGLAFFRGGMMLMLCGLGIMLGGQILECFLNQLSFKHGFSTAGIALLADRSRWWGIGILGITGYSGVHAAIHGRDRWSLRALISMVGFWAVHLLLGAFSIRFTLTCTIAMLAFEVWSLVEYRFGSDRNVGADQTSQTRANSIASSTIVTVTMLLLLGFAGAESFVSWVWTGSLFVSWQHVVQLALIAVGGVLTPVAWNHHRSTDGSQGLAQVSFWAAGLAGGTAGFIAALKVCLATVPVLLVGSAVVVAVVSIAVYLASHEVPVARKLNWYVSGTNLAVIALWGIYGSTLPSIGWGSLLACAITGLIATSYCLLGSLQSRMSLAGGILLAAISVAQAMVYLGWHGPYVSILLASIVGWAGVITLRLSPLNLDANRPPEQQNWLVGGASSLVVLAAMAAVLFTLFSLGQSTGHWSRISLLAAQAVGLTVSSLFAGSSDWRKSFLAGVPITLITAVIAVMAVAEFSIDQYFEISLLLAGAMLTIGAYLGWAQETNGPQDSTTAAFFTGTLLLIAPFVFGVVNDRLAGHGSLDAWRNFHEIGGLLTGLILLGSGMLCRVRWTTFGGGFLLSVVVFSNLLLIRLPEQLQTTSVLMMAGGGTFFVTALLLSIYRDRILELPQHFRDGKGVFGIAKWR